jgi:anaerobic selenocysteine-containing dehydrogenase
MSDAKTGLSRRGLFQIAGVAGAALAAEGCTERERRPIGPERNVQTTCGACPAGCGIVVRAVGPKSQDAVRITGLAGHPVNDGGMCPRGIAEIQNLYHPERLHGPLARRPATGKFAPIGWAEALERLAEKARASEVVFGAGDLGRGERQLLRAIAARREAAVVDARIPWGAPPAEALRRMLGSEEWSFDLPRATFILSLGADWLQSFPSPVEAQRAFAAVRGGPRRTRLVTADARLSVTAARGDDWIPVARHDLPEFALCVAHAMLKVDPALAARSPAFAALAGEGRFAATEAGKRLGIRPRLVESTADGLRLGGLVVVDGADPGVQAAGMALNLLAGAIGRPGGVVSAAAPPLPADLREPQVREGGEFPRTRAAPVVILAGANPAHLALPRSGWEALARASFVVSLSPFLDESAERADLVLPVSTPLESRSLTWGCTLEGRGFVSAGPAVVRPLYDTLEWPEVLLRVGRALGVELPWKDASAWFSAMAEALSAQELLKKGGFKILEPAPATPLPADPGAWAAEAVRSALSRPWPPAFPLGLAVHVPLAFPGGSGAHLPYLHGIAQVSGREIWQTAVELHPDTARALHVFDGSPVWVESARASIRAVARLRQGIRPDSAGIALGLGRKAVGAFAAGRGENPLDLLDWADPAFVRVRVAT